MAQETYVLNDRNRSFVFVKPPHSLIDGRNFEIMGYLDALLENDEFHSRPHSFTRTLNPHLIRNVPQELLIQHYAHCRELPFFEEMIKAYSQGIFPLVYLGQDIAFRIFDIVGDKDPLRGKSWEVRRRFSLAPKGKSYATPSFYGWCDSLQHAKREGRVVENVLHRSGYHLEEGKQIWEGEQEIALWANFLKANGIDIPEL